MKLPIVSGMKIVKMLTKYGFEIKGRKGSHVTLEKGEFRVTVPLHNEIGYGLLIDIIKQSGYKREEFLKIIKKS